MTALRKFTEWLGIHPSPQEIARAVVTDYLFEYSVRGIRFGRINSDDSVIVIGQYGHPDEEKYLGRLVPSEEWRQIDSEDIRIIKGETKTMWSSTSNMYVATLRHRGIIQGYLIVSFNNPIPEDKKNEVAQLIDDLCIPISLYISLTVSPKILSSAVLNIPADAGDRASLTQRQTLILKGMVEGKTNHELAIELGYSVSTIRHETMRIYQALAVSDRREAAKVALSLSLV